MPENNTVLMEDVRIIFRNFEGKEGPYNREGDRGFSVLLPEDIAKQMEADGWNVKYLKPRDDEPESERQPYLQVAVKYGKGRPPQITLLTSRGRQNLTEDEVEILDWVDIKQVDLIVRPYHWVVQEGTDREASGIKAYLKSMYITIEEDELALKYADLDDLPARGGKIDE